MVMSNSYRQRMMAIVEQLHKQGVNRYTSAPPLFRMLWRLGYDVRPPLYQSFWAIALGLGGLYFAFMAFFTAIAIMCVAFSPLARGPMTAAFVVHLAARPLGACVASGVFFGMSMAGYFRWKAARVQLPPLE